MEKNKTHGQGAPVRALLYVRVRSAVLVSQQPLDGVAAQGVAQRGHGYQPPVKFKGDPCVAHQRYGVGVGAQYEQRHPIDHVG